MYMTLDLVMTKYDSKSTLLEKKSSKIDFH